VELEVKRPPVSDGLPVAWQCGELENVMRRYVVLRDPELIARESHRKISRGAPRGPPLERPADQLSLSR
jgi:hypothetical protein